MSKGKQVKQWFQCPVYFVKVFIVLGGCPDEATTEFCKAMQSPEPLPQECEAFNLTTGNAEMIYLPRKLRTAEDYNLLTHEVFHLVTSVLCGRGVEFDEEGANEAFAYYAGFWVEQIINLSRGKNENG